MQIWAFILDSFRESRDKKLFWVMLLVSTMAALVLACFGFDENGWSLFFGMYKKADPLHVRGSPAAVGLMAAIVSNFLIATYIGWLGTVACLAATAGIFPNFMQSGGIDVVLSKPIRRMWVFLGKYVGSLGFVLVQAVYFVLLSFLILRWQVGQWLWGYLWTIPLLVALFSFLYCVCVLMAMLTRSGLASLLVTLLFWMMIPGVAAIDDILSNRMSLSGPPGPEKTWADLNYVGKAVRVVRWALPKTGDVPSLVANCMGAATLDETMELFAGMAPADANSGAGVHIKMDDDDRENLRREDRRQAGLTVLNVIGSSLGFEAVILLIAGRMFCRRDF